jgi:hypothetical protein
MGTRSRQRKADKRRRRQRASAPKAERTYGARPSVRELIWAAATAGPAERAAMAERLAALAGAEAELEAMLAEVEEAARRGNWERHEIERQVERRLGAGHASYVGAGRRQLAGADGLARALAVLGLMARLPPLPAMGAPPPPAGGGHADSRMLAKVRALLAKAESTTFPEEAEALSAKAQELMARHAIDEAMVGHAGGAGAGASAPSGPSGPAGVRLAVDDPYASAKSMLLAAVAAANRCRTVWMPDVALSAVFGYPADLEFVEVLYTSLLVQATSAMAAAGPQVDGAGRSRTRSFRQAFLLSYAARIGERLRAAGKAAEAEAVEVHGQVLVPVLAGRSAAVEEACASAFPNTVRRSLSISNAAGWRAGRTAADVAALTGRVEVPARA